MILERSATKLSWQLVEGLSQLLDRDDCETVKGDIAEADLSCWQAMSDVFGLVVRRQVAPWRNWRPVARCTRAWRAWQLSADGILAFHQPGVSAVGRALD